MAGIPVDVLDEETRQRLGLKLAPDIGKVGDRLIVLGKVFRVLKGLTNEDALCILQQAQWYIQEQNDSVLGDYSDEVKTATYVPPSGWTIQIVAKAFNFNPSDLKQRKRDAKVVLARQVAMYVLWGTDKYSLAQIGQALGGRSPATVSHGFQRIANQLAKDPTLKDKITEIQSRLSIE